MENRIITWAYFGAKNSTSEHFIIWKHTFKTCHDMSTLLFQLFFLYYNEINLTFLWTFSSVFIPHARPVADAFHLFSILLSTLRNVDCCFLSSRTLFSLFCVALISTMKGRSHSAFVWTLGSGTASRKPGIWSVWLEYHVYVQGVLMFNHWHCIHNSSVF